jgi:prephenate dehydratase
LGIAYGDNASAAAYVAESRDITCAALASSDTALLYGLEVLAEGVADRAENFTRFIVIRAGREFSSDGTKCSLEFVVPHTPGSLISALKVLSDNGANLTKIESRPLVGEMFEYVFYADVIFASPESIEFVLGDFTQKTVRCRILGLYPSATML